MKFFTTHLRKTLKFDWVIYKTNYNNNKKKELGVLETLKLISILSEKKQRFKNRGNAFENLLQ